MLLWLLTRLTYLAGEPDGVKCILIRMFSRGMDGARGERDEDIVRGEWKAIDGGGEEKLRREEEANYLKERTFKLEVRG